MAQNGKKWGEHVNFNSFQKVSIKGILVFLLFSRMKMIMKGGAYVARAKRVPGVEERSQNYPINATLLATGHTVNRIHSTNICWIIQQSELVFVFCITNYGNA